MHTRRQKEFRAQETSILLNISIFVPVQKCETVNGNLSPKTYDGIISEASLPVNVYREGRNLQVTISMILAIHTDKSSMMDRKKQQKNRK